MRGYYNQEKDSSSIDKTSFKKELPQLLKVLKSGGIILYPTDTIWGIGCDATNTEAIEKIYALKKREDLKSMLLLLDNESRLQTYVSQVPEIAWELISVSDKPITIIYPGAKNLASNLPAKDDSIGIRISLDPFNRELIQQLGKPLVSTSANISGSPTPHVFDEISDEIKSGVDYITVYRQEDLERRQTSSIIKLNDDGSFVLIRK